MASLPGVRFSEAQAIAGRRVFLRSGGVGLGAFALSLLESRRSRGAALDPTTTPALPSRVHPPLPGLPHHAPHSLAAGGLGRQHQ
jgi:hypothetical protein